MPSMQVKDFPQELYDQFKAYADAHHRSMSQQLIVAAERLVGQTDIGAPTDQLAAYTEVDDDEARRIRAEKRQRLFSRIKATADEARKKGVWVDDGRDYVDVVAQGRLERARQQCDALGVPFDKGALA